MSLADIDWLSLVINLFPLLMIIGVWAIFLRRGGVFSNQKRAADALERIAAALEKRG